MTKPNIRNYTSEVAATKSIAMIEAKLVAHGATDIMKQYDNGMIKGMAFRKVHNMQHLAFQLPANVEQVYKVMLSAKGGRHTVTALQNLRKQAERTAWKNVFDWVDIQMTLIAMEQAEFAEVFLPYMLVGKDETVFQKLNNDGFKALMPGN